MFPVSLPLSVVLDTVIANQLTCLQLGGIGDDGTYSLGDDALLCLKDLRKWLKFADTQLNRRDVARCMAESNLVKGDLLEILAKVSPRAMEDKWRHKIAVAACK
jgi:replication fork protection complex subunit Tof1/Swi1